MSLRRQRNGFTLVELLVVTGLMAALLGLILAGARPAGVTQVRELSQALSSTILAAQTRAIGTEQGAALMLIPSTAIAGGIAADAVHFANIMPAVTGIMPTGTGSIAPPSPTGTFSVPPQVSGSLALTATSTTVSLVPDNADPSDLAACYRIRFSGTVPMTASPWLEFRPSALLGSGTVSLRSAENQTLDNFVWPVVSSSGTATLAFELSRYPIQSMAAFTTPRAAAIDLRYSGIGVPGLGNYGSLNGRGVISITFDRTGAFDQIMQSGAGGSLVPQPITPTAPLFLLVATTESIRQNTSLWANESRWITLAPGTGRAHVSPNVVVTGTTDVMAARALARQGVSGGGR